MKFILSLTMLVSVGAFADESEKKSCGTEIKVVKELRTECKQYDYSTGECVKQGKAYYTTKVKVPKAC